MLWIYGINPVESVLKNRPKDVKELVIIKTFDEKKENERLDAVIALAKKHNIRVNEKNTNDLSEELKAKTTTAHQRVFALVNPPKIYELKELLGENKDVGRNNGGDFFLMLDGITDVHNIGAIIRTAAAMGVDAIILPKDRTATITADVYKTSAGAVENIKIVTEVNLTRCVEMLKKAEFWVYGFEEDGTKNIYSADLKGKICCVIGGEDTGIRRLLKENCDIIFKIPLKTGVQSLNASVSAAIVIYEAARQKNNN
ncbi:MAG: 23S rRNA (guanosine(2251)-2'-O)-methyltransferase RlmB [Pseudomonadota bacterium]